MPAIGTAEMEKARARKVKRKCIDEWQWIECLILYANNRKQGPDRQKATTEKLVSDSKKGFIRKAGHK